MKTKRQLKDEAEIWAASYFGGSREPAIDLYVRIRELEEKLNRIEPNNEILEKYPALKEAYEIYKITKVLTLGE